MWWNPIETFCPLSCFASLLSALSSSSSSPRPEFFYIWSIFSSTGLKYNTTMDRVHPSISFRCYLILESHMRTRSRQALVHFLFHCLYVGLKKDIVIFHANHTDVQLAFDFNARWFMVMIYSITTADHVSSTDHFPLQSDYYFTWL